MVERTVASRVPKILWLICVVCLLAGCASCPKESVSNLPPLRVRAEPWPEATRNFRSDPHWLGGDGASSVDLGRGRVLWLFGDSFVDPSGSGNRRNAALVRNSVAIQTGYDPSRADLSFFWGKTGAGSPRSFFPEDDPHWYWPGDGIRVEESLVVFLMTIGPADNELGFQVVGWASVLIANPESSPPAWNLRPLSSPRNPYGIVVGSASVLMWDGFVYAFSAQAETRAVFLARWRAASFAAGDLSGLEWWGGESHGWIASAPGPGDASSRPTPLFANGQIEFSVQFVPSVKRWLQVQTQSFMEPYLAARWAAHPTGRWSAMESFFRPEFMGRPGVLIYAGKSHPECTGAQLVFTYAVNPLDADRLLDDKSVYYPEFVRGALEPCAGSHPRR